jgi:hypothetical protein
VYDDFLHATEFYEYLLDHSNDEPASFFNLEKQVGIEYAKVESDEEKAHLLQ